jgi:mannosyltransferase
MFVLSRRLAQPRVALLATVLMACSAFQVWSAQEVRMYALVTLAVLIAVYALVPAWQQGGMGAWVVCSGALLAALYLDYSAFYVYSALVIWFVVVGRRRAPIRRPFVVSSLVLSLGYLSWLPAFWR